MLYCENVCHVTCMSPQYVVQVLTPNGHLQGPDLISYVILRTTFQIEDIFA